MISGFFNTLPTIASSLFTFDVLIALLIGVVGGMVIGALPGLSATMGIALMIPFTYAMEPTAALVMLMTIYTSAIAGGSISAILIHTPVRRHRLQQQWTDTLSHFRAVVWRLSARLWSVP